MSFCFHLLANQSTFTLGEKYTSMFSHILHIYAIGCKNVRRDASINMRLATNWVWGGVDFRQVLKLSVMTPWSSVPWAQGFFSFGRADYLSLSRVELNLHSLIYFHDFEFNEIHNVQNQTIRLLFHNLSSKVLFHIRAFNETHMKCYCF